MLLLFRLKMVVIVCDQNNREKKIKKSSSQDQKRSLKCQSRRLVFSNRRIFLRENQGQKKPNFLETFFVCFLLVLVLKGHKKTKKKEKIQHTILSMLKVIVFIKTVIIRTRSVFWTRRRRRLHRRRRLTVFVKKTKKKETKTTVEVVGLVLLLRTQKR